MEKEEGWRRRERVMEEEERNGDGREGWGRNRGMREECRRERCMEEEERDGGGGEVCVKRLEEHVIRAVS